MNDLTTEQKTQAMTPANLLTIAVQQGADLDRLEKLMELQERWEKNEARKAFVAAMQAFKANPPDIYKNKHVKFKTSAGFTEYDQPTLDHVADEISPALSAHGLSHRWDVQQADGMIRVSCIITHLLGHSESTTMQAGADSSGGKNSIQAIASAVTYLQRYTLLAATGLAARGVDDDGRGAVERISRISEVQAHELEALLTTTKSDRAKFLAFLGVSSLELLPVADFAKAKKALEAKRKSA